jgi:predicted transcriptional regulator
MVEQDGLQKFAEEGQEEMKDQIQKDIERLAKRCLKAGIPPNVAQTMMVLAMQNEWKRKLIEVPGLVKK